MAMDKDTFIAQNLFPKNLSVENIRKPRFNVKPVDVSYANRKTKITFCVLGSWAIYMPPYNLARLSALTREAGYLTRVFDFNVESHYALKDANPDLCDAWNGANYWWWQAPEYYKRIHPTYEPILDEYINIIVSEDIDILGFSVYYTNILATLYVVKKIKQLKPNITIIMGGPQCHPENKFIKPDEVSYYFVGESEQNILDFLNNWENGIKPDTDAIGSLFSDTRIDIDSLPYPDYSDFDLTKYWGENSICAEISRGCIARCTYCTEVYYWKFRDRGAQTVVDEIEYQVKKYNIKFVSFVDSLMNGNLKEFRNFCQELVDRKLGINWWGYARADGRMDLGFYKLMASAGCQGFNYGIETGSDKVLKAINKKNTVAEINQNLIDSHKVGMKVSACWVIGAPGEDIEAFAHSFNMLWNHRARIYAVSPGPGLGDNYGSAYDDREKFNINPRSKPWLGGWYTLDLTNTKLHRYIRIKLMHIWLHICKEYGGTLTNVHAVGDITDHFNVKFDSDFINNEVPYEDFDYSIIKSGLGEFADSVMNEVFGLLRMLWRVRGGYEITINFNEVIDHKDFIFAITPETHTFESIIHFKIDDAGNYSVKNYYKFVNSFKDVVDIDGFDYIFIDKGTWTESKKSTLKKVFFIKQEFKQVLPIESCFSAMSVDERQSMFNFCKCLDKSTIVEIGSGLGGKASILSRANPDSIIYSVEEFSSTLSDDYFNSTSKWIKSQIVDFSRMNESNAEDAVNLVDAVESSLKTDPSGKLAWQTITKPYKNIHLVDESSITEDLIDVLVLNTGSDSSLDKWIPRLKSKGYLICNHYVNTHLSLLRYVDSLICTGWEIVDHTGILITIRKP